MTDAPLSWPAKALIVSGILYPPWGCLMLLLAVIKSVCDD